MINWFEFWQKEFVQASKHGYPAEVPEITHDNYFHIISTVTLQ